MKPIIFVVCPALLMLAIPFTVLADTATWSIDGPSMETPVDFGMLLPNISAVTVQVQGYSGGPCCSCSGPGGSTQRMVDTSLEVWCEPIFPYVDDCEITGHSASGSTSLPATTDYDRTVTMRSPYWGFLEDGTMTLGLGVCRDYLACLSPTCSISNGCGTTVTVTHVTITVTYTSLVPAEEAAWSAIKNCYR